LTWTADEAALTFVAFRYAPALAALSLGWEAAHVRLYTIWSQEPLSSVAFAVVHCTLGDMLIGTAALTLALILQQAGRLREWRFGRIAAATTALGIGYLLFSEWLNVTVLQTWAYAVSMPRIQLGGFELGLSPLFQWLLLPAMSLYLARCRVSA
jgi:hypothetical protein